MREERVNKVKSVKKVSGWRKIRQQKKRRNQRKYMMTSPKLTSIFKRHFAIGLCIAIVMCFVGTIGAVSYYREVMMREFYIYTNTFASEIAENYEKIAERAGTDEEKLELWKTQVRWNLNSKKGGFGYDGCLYDVNTREIFVEPEQRFYVFLIENYGTEKKTSAWYECDFELLEDAFNKCLETEKTRDVFPEMVLQDMYIKNGEFIPGKMQLIINYPDDGEIIKEYDYTPEDTTGYKHIVLEGDESTKVIGPTTWWFLEENPTTKAMINDYVENGIAFEDGTKAYIWDGEFTSVEGTTFWGWQEVFNDPVTIGDGQEYMLVMAVDVNLFKSYGVWVVVAYIVVLLLTIIICYTIAYRNYMIRLNHYQLDKYRRDTTNAMAHDLKTPLMAISGYAENLRANVHSEKKDYYADTILEHVQYMNEMVGNILELAKVESVATVLNKETVNLKSITEDILKKYEILTVDKKLQVAIDGEATIQADAAMMAQAIENLLGNAMKYAAKETEIHIRMEKDSYEILNVVENQLQNPVEDLWKPFVKGDNSRNDQKGTGIGLTIVKNIAEAHGFELILQCEEKEFVARIEYYSPQ